jgi:uncharacterized protein
MRVWVDLTNSPHVNFFAEMIRDLLRAGHEVIITCRPLANTVDLLKLQGFDYHVVGRHYGVNPIKKAMGYPVRVSKLMAFLRGRHVDVAIGHSSFELPAVSRFLGVRSIYLNDNEYAVANRVAFPCATTIMIPEFLSLAKVRRQWANPRKVVRYPGVKEAIYLFRLDGVCRGLRDRRSAGKIFVRPEPSTAQYYSGGVNFMDDLIGRLKERYTVVIMPRDQRQAEHYCQDRFGGVVIPPKPLSLEAVIEECSLFIGAGGTMTREAAVLGIPTISTYQDELLDVDRYLIAQKRMIHEQRLTADRVIELMESTRDCGPSPELLEKGREAYNLILSHLLNGGAASVPHGG